LNFTKKAEPQLPRMVAPAGSAAAKLAAPSAEVAPPVKRAEKPKEAAPKPKAGLANMMDEWGDDK
jgi:hypothetical protein